MELEEIRETITAVDEQITALFTRRMELVEEIARIKHQSGMNVRDHAREQDVLAHVAEIAGPDYAPYAQELYTQMLHISREYQRNLMIRADDALPKAADTTK